MRLVKTRASTLSEEDTKELLALIHASEDAHRKFVNRADRWNKFFKGDQWDEESDEENRATVNLSYALVQSLVPMLIFREPTVVARPTHPLNEGKEVVWSHITNNSLPRIDFAAEATKQVRDAIVAGEGWTKLVFFEKEEDLGKRIGTGGPYTEAFRKLTPWNNISIPAWIRIPPKHVIVDEQSSDRSLASARFVAIRYLKDPDELRADPRYKNLPVDFDVADIEKIPTSGSTGVASHKERYLIPIYEVWVYQLVKLKLYKQVVVVMKGAPKPIRDILPWEELVGADPDWPFERITFNEPMEGYPVSDVESVAELQLLFNWAFSTIINGLDDQREITEVNTAQVKEPAKLMAELEEPGKRRVIAETNAIGSVLRLPGTSVSRDAYNALGIIDNYYTRVSGVSEAAQGGAKSVRTASEVAVVNQGVELKTEHKAGIVHKSLKRMIEKWMRLVRQTVGQDRNFVMRLAGDTGNVRWFEFSSEDLAWEPEVEIEVGSFRKAAMADILQRWTAAINLLMQLIPVLGPGARVDRAAYEMLKALDLPANSLIASSSDEQMLAMADIVLIMAGQDVGPDPQGSPAIRIQVIDFFLNSPAAQAVASTNPEALQRVRMLRQGYQEMILQQSQSATSMHPAPGSNPLDFQNMSPANEARSRSASRREAVTPQNGNAGQMA